MTTAVPQPQDPPREHNLPSESTGLHPRLSRRKLLARIGCGTLVGGLTVGGGLTWAYGPGGPLSYEAKRLRQLEKDPMGTKEILGHKAVHIDDSPLPKWFEWKYPGTHLRRWFRNSNADSKQLMNEFIEFAENHKWENDPGPTTPSSWIGRHGGTRPVDDMVLAIYLPSDDPSPPKELENTVVVSLHYF